MRNPLTRKIMSNQRLIEEYSAWEFMAAARDLFPEWFEELEAIAVEGLDTEDDDDPWLSDLYPAGASYEQAVDRVGAWLEESGLDCPAIEEAATQMGAGASPRDRLRVHLFRGGKAIKGPLPIEAMPFRETLDEFLAKARKHYAAQVAFYEQHGYKQGPVKRGEVEHFRYLAAHLIGGYTWAEIAHGDTPLRLQSKSAKTVAGEARKAADLIGITLGTKRGRRPGARRHRRLP